MAGNRDRAVSRAALSVGTGPRKLLKKNQNHFDTPNVGQDAGNLFVPFDPSRLRGRFFPHIRRLATKREGSKWTKRR